MTSYKEYAVPILVGAMTLFLLSLALRLALGYPLAQVVTGPDAPSSQGTRILDALKDDSRPWVVTMRADGVSYRDPKGSAYSGLRVMHDTVLGTCVWVDSQDVTEALTGDDKRLIRDALRERLRRTQLNLIHKLGP